MRVAMTTEPWPPYRGRRHRPNTPTSTSSRERIHPWEVSHSHLHEARRRSTSTRSTTGSQQAISRSLSGSRQRRCIKVRGWSLFVLWLLLLYAECGLCAKLAPARESVPSVPSYNVEGEQDPLARLSKVFGISRIPAKAIHRTPPQYMTELFREVADTGGLTKASGPYDANTIRSFPDRDTVHQEHYFYNVSHLPPQGSEEERMLEAEFRLFKMKPRPSRSAEAPPPHHLQLKVYQVLDKDKMNSPEGLRLLDVQRISTHRHGWITFKVSKAVDKWRSRSQENHGLLVVAQSQRGQNYSGSYLRFAQRNHHHDSKQPILVVFSEDTASAKHPTFVSPNDQDYREILEEMNERQLQKASAEEKQKEQTKAQPKTKPEPEANSNVSGSKRNVGFRQAVFMLNERAREEPTRPRPSPTPSKSRGRRKRQASSSSSSSKKRRQGTRRKRTYSLGGYRYRSSCSKHKMYVDFDEIGWSGWIISPKGYDAYHCTGQCPFPLGQSQKPTNHATVQSIVHALGVGSKNLGTPCCVPNKLFSISLLYFDDDENVILKQYDDMVAASCGCH